MKTASLAVRNYLYLGNEYLPAELYDLTVQGTTYRWTSAGRDIVYGGNTYSASGPGIKRGRSRQATGLEIASIEVTIAAGSVTLAGTPLLLAAVRGYFDNAPATISRVFLDSAGAVVGGMTVFAGTVIEAKPGTTELVLTVRSALAMFDRMLPRRHFRVECPYVVYDPLTCKMSAAGFTDATKTVAAGSTTKSIVLSAVSAMAVPGSIITLTAGALAGTKCVAASVSGTTVTLTDALASVPAVGVGLSILRGCDHKRDTCSSIFGNMLRYGGFPDTPVPK